MVKTMTNEKYVRDFSEKVVITICYIQNRIYIRIILNKNSYELWKGKTKFNISYFYQFGCPCYVLKSKEHFNKLTQRHNCVYC